MMSQTLTTKSPDEIYEVLQWLAPDMGMTVEELAMEWVALYAKKPSPQLTGEARQWRFCSRGWTRRTRCAMR